MTNETLNSQEQQDTFIPVKANKRVKGEKGTTKKLIVDKYPDIPTITISKEEPKKAKSLLFNTKAIEKLGLKAGELESISLTRGYPKGDKEKAMLFVSATNEEHFVFVNKKGNGQKIKTAPLKFTTQKMQSASLHGIMLDYYSNNMVNEDKVYVIGKEYHYNQNTAFVLEELDVYLERTQQLQINIENKVEDDSTVAADKQETTVTNNYV